MGLVFLLLSIFLLLLPGAIYGCIFFIPITQSELDYYAKFGAWFTAIGAIFTIINTIVVIYLMIFLHKKENEFNMLNNFSELRKRFTYISTILKDELAFFVEKEYEIAENLYAAQNGFDAYQYKDLYKLEATYLREIVKSLQEVYQTLITLKEKCQLETNITLVDYQTKLKLLDHIDDLLILKKPSSEYQRGFVEGSREDVDPEDMVEVSNKNAIEAIANLKVLLAI